ncbi:uncharacterized protein LOC142639688 [Castanea sativa]|uniref:uncharacterized protein LOC142639688 n=1 Tax=Castanea sativa TaxID=21020 RepID=UPI003F64E9BC
MQLEIDYLKRKLRYESQRRTPSFSGPSSDDTKDNSYRSRSRTPLGESFSYEEDNLHGRRAIRTFKVGLPAEHDLRKSLTKKLVRSVCRLMDRIDEYKRVEEDQQQGKGKAKVIPQGRRDFREGRLKQFLYRPKGQGDHPSLVNQGNTSSRPPLGKINVIFAALGRTGSRPSKVMSVARTLVEDSNFKSKRTRGNIQPALSFSEEDKIGTTQPHDDVLVVTLRIGGMT